MWGLGPIFDTATKKDAGEGIGPLKIREVKDAIKVPVVCYWRESTRKTARECYSKWS